MQFDWITVAAQIVNFLVLLWLLQRFLYRPVIEAMDRREAGIAARIAAAEERERDAVVAANEYKAQTTDFESRRAQMFEEAEAGAEAEQQRLMTEARRQVEDERAMWLKGVRTDQTEFLAALNEVAASEICAIAKDVLGDLAHAELEPQLAAVFIEKLAALGADERAALAAAAREADGRVAVATPMALPTKARDHLRSALRQVVGDDVHVRFVTDDTASLGIRVMVGSQTLSWSVEGYLGQLEQRLLEEIRELAPGHEER